jgi:predicted phosphodiesterase
MLCPQMSSLRTAAFTIVIMISAVIHQTLKFFKPNHSETATSYTPVTHPVVTDLKLCISTTTRPPPTGVSSLRQWHRVHGDLYLYQSNRIAWLDVEYANEKDLSVEDLVVVDITVGESPPQSDSGDIWESLSGGIWVLRRKFPGKIDQVVTEVDVLFGTDAVDPRPHWDLMGPSIQLNAALEIPVARLSVLRGRTKPRADNRAPLRVKENGKFKIMQISDTHMVTGVGTCKDAIDAHGKKLRQFEADPRTVALISKKLDEEKPDLVIIDGDALHHDNPDSKSALFKVVAPIIQRSIRFAFVFGNHDSEGPHALSRKFPVLYVSTNIQKCHALLCTIAVR